MGLQIRRVTQTKYKLLFASLAIMAIAVQPMYGFVAGKVANAETNGSTSASTPTGEFKNSNASYQDWADYKGIYVQVGVENVSQLEDLSVVVNRTNGGAITKTATQKTIDSYNTIGTTSKSAPIVITPGTYDEAGSSSWNAPVNPTWNTTTVPTDVVLTMTFSDGSTKVKTLNISSESKDYSDVVPVTPEIHNVRFSTMSKDSGKTYDGIVIDSYVKGFTDVKGIKVVVERADGSEVFRRGNGLTRNYIANGGDLPLTTPFSFEGNSGTGWWNPQDANWNEATKPVRVTITVNTASHGKVIFSTPVSQNLVETNGTFSSLVGPAVESATINGQTVNMADTRTENCEPVKNSYSIHGEVDLDATLKDLSGMGQVFYKVKRLGSNGCTHEGTDRVKMHDSGSNVWQENTDQVFDTKNANNGDLSGELNGLYTIVLVTKDAVGNKTTKYIDITIDNIAPDKVTITSPTTGQEFEASGGEDKVRAEWTPVEDAVNYQIKYAYEDDGEEVTPTRKTTNTYRDQRLGGDVIGDFTITVRAQDAAGNWGEWSDPVTYYYGASAPVDDTDTDVDNNSGSDAGTPDNRGTTDGDDDLESAKTIDPNAAQRVSDPTESQRSLGANSIFNRNFAFNTTTDDEDAATDTLGDSTFNQPVQGEVKGAADDKSSTASFFGLAWYWWILILAALLAAIWWIAAAARKKQDA